MRILITGANRGLGKEIAGQLIQRNHRISNPHSIHLTARQNALHQLEVFQENRFVTISAMDLGEKNPSEFENSIKSFPSFDYVIHTASPYTGCKLTEATPEQLREILTCQYNETFLLTSLATNLAINGSLVATGAIIGAVVGPDYIQPNNPWYIGLSSLHKANLRAVMSSLYQEMPMKKIIHANLGAFRDEVEFAQEITDGDALSTTSVGAELIKLAESDQRLESFNIDILTNKEKLLMETFKLQEREAVQHSPFFFK